VTWEEMEKVVNGFFEAPPAIIARVRAAMTGK
jgi:hypothetical protein